MNFVSQVSAIEQLDTLSKSRRQSILIEGVKGCGKSYLARMYATMLGVEEFVLVSPKVAELRETIDQSISSEADVVVCIENLDCGVVGASYTLLKFLEEPAPNIFVVITCRNMNLLPDTIMSRSAVVSVSHPLPQDIDQYAKSKDSTKYASLSSQPIWKCVRSYSDADIVLGLTPSNLSYFSGLNEVAQFNDSVSNIVWKLGHYEDNTETPVELVIRYIMDLVKKPTVVTAGVECITDLASSRFAQHAVLSKFAFTAKYIE